jgi:hypothetical protein
MAIKRPLPFQTSALPLLRLYKKPRRSHFACNIVRHHVTETTLLNNKSSGLYKAGSPLKALAAETCNLTVNGYGMTFSIRYRFLFRKNQSNLALNTC